MGCIYSTDAIEPISDEEWNQLAKQFSSMKEPEPEHIKFDYKKKSKPINIR